MTENIDVPQCPEPDLPCISLFDSNFEHHPNSSSLASYPGYERQPTHFRWVRSNQTHTLDICVFTDNELHRAKKVNCRVKIAWLLEPRELCPTVYDYAIQNKDDFDLILTHNNSFLDVLGSKGRFYIYGGSWVPDNLFGIHSKPKMVSMVASHKRQLEGHQLRHEVISVYRPKYHFDVMGNGYRPIKELSEALVDYKFSIVIENVNSGIVSEKLLSCLATGTIPIYWGCESRVRQYFCPGGILFFRNMDELNRILHNISIDGDRIYSSVFRNVRTNIGLAEEMFLTEDWLWNKVFKYL